MADLKKHNNILIHIAAWLAFFSLPFLVGIISEKAPLPPQQLQELQEHRSVITFLLIHFALIGFYYLNSNVLIPRLLLNKKAILYSFLVLVYYLIFIFNFKALVVYADPKTGFSPPQEVVNVVSRLIATLVFLLVLLASTGIRLTQKWYAIEKEKVETELSFLKAQINPHFLFNTLNSIYTLALKNDSQTSNAVMQLSTMMRYVTVEAKSDTVSLEKELQYVRHFVALQQLRMPKNMVLETQFLCQNLHLPIAPMLLIPFIENAFKYGISTRTSATIKMSLSEENNILQLNVENQKFKSINETKDRTSIGLENTKQRLELLYPNRYKLIINDLEDKYWVELKIELC
jgi:two-component system, LytTR family, sensor kinase